MNATNTNTEGRTMTTRFGFEALLTDGSWSQEAAGQQNASNTFATRDEAEKELPALAAALECSVAEVRVVAIEV